jgi:hypothetical protein
MTQINAGPSTASNAFATSAIRQTRVFFEYVGPTALTVIGPVTGKSYRFARRGARLEVDLKDRRSIAAVPSLRQIHFGGH